MPIVGHELKIPDDRASGTFRIAFDVMLGEDAPGSLSLILRGVNTAGRRVTPGNILLGPEVINANGWNLMALQSGRWYHVEMSLPFGPERSRMFELSATSVDGGTQRGSFPYLDRSFDRLNSISLAGLGATESLIYIDNLVLRLDD